MPENKGNFGAVGCKSFVSFGSGCTLVVPLMAGATASIPQPLGNEYPFIRKCPTFKLYSLKQ